NNGLQEGRLRQVILEHLEAEDVLLRIEFRYAKAEAAAIRAAEARWKVEGIRQSIEFVGENISLVQNDGRGSPVGDYTERGEDGGDAAKAHHGELGMENGRWKWGIENRG